MTTIAIDRATVEWWKSQVNTLAATSPKADRYRVGAALKQSMADALAAPATAPDTPYQLVPMGEPPHQSKAWIAPLSGKVSAIPVEGFVMLDRDMREWAQARKMHVCWAGGWHVMIGKTWCTTGCDTPGRAVEACWESGEYDDLDECAALSAPATANEPAACLVETEQGPMVWPIADIKEASTYCEPDEFPELLYKRKDGATAGETGAAMCRRARQIDERFAHRLSLAVESMLIDPERNRAFAEKQLSEYTAAWDAINPGPQTFMGEPVLSSGELANQEKTSGSPVEDYSDCHGPDWRDRDGEYLK